MTKLTQDPFSVLITENSDKLFTLNKNWNNMQYSATDGLGSMESLHEAGDSLVAVVNMDEETPHFIGSGVMIAPGLLLTATHVLEEFHLKKQTPMFMTFLSTGARAWLPIANKSVVSKKQEDVHQELISDLSIVTCTLNSEPQINQPLMLAPMKISQPLIGDRVWAFGFRHQGNEDSTMLVTPMVSSGIVTQAYPQGRGSRMPAPCFEVDMDTMGGMSGGPVVDSEGNVIGIISSSFEGGPSYVTLIWEALTLSFDTQYEKLKKYNPMNLLRAKKFDLVKLDGNVEKKPWGDVIFRFTDDEYKTLRESSHNFEFTISNQLHGQELGDFVEEWLPEIESEIEQSIADILFDDSLDVIHTYLNAIPNINPVDEIYDSTVNIFEGIEDIEIISILQQEDDKYKIDIYFDLRIVIWNLDLKFKDTSEITNFEMIHRCYFKGVIFFDKNDEIFTDFSINWRAVKRYA